MSSRAKNVFFIRRNESETDPLEASFQFGFCVLCFGLKSNVYLHLGPFASLNWVFFFFFSFLPFCLFYSLLYIFGMLGLFLLFSLYLFYQFAISSSILSLSFFLHSLRYINSHTFLNPIYYNWYLVLLTFFLLILLLTVIIFFFSLFTLFFLSLS